MTILVYILSNPNPRLLSLFTTVPTKSLYTISHQNYNLKDALIHAKSQSHYTLLLSSDQCTTSSRKTLAKLFTLATQIDYKWDILILTSCQVGKAIPQTPFYKTRSETDFKAVLLAPTAFSKIKKRAITTEIPIFTTMEPENIMEKKYLSIYLYIGVVIVMLLFLLILLKLKR